MNWFRKPATEAKSYTENKGVEWSSKMKSVGQNAKYDCQETVLVLNYNSDQKYFTFWGSPANKHFSGLLKKFPNPIADTKKLNNLGSVIEIERRMTNHQNTLRGH